MNIFGKKKKSKKKEKKSAQPVLNKARSKTAQKLFNNLNKQHFNNFFASVVFHCLPAQSFKYLSRADDPIIHLHPDLFLPGHTKLLQFQIYRQMLQNLETEHPLGTQSLAFRRTEAKIGDLPKLVRLQRKFHLNLYEKYAAHLELEQPHYAELVLYVCPSCRAKSSLLSASRPNCHHCKKKSTQEMKQWDVLDIVQHYKYSPSPADYITSEHDNKKIYIFEDAYLRHFLQK